MRIDVRRLSGTEYQEVKIIEDNTVIELGLLGTSELKKLARQFEEAVDDLLSGIENYE